MYYYIATGYNANGTSEACMLRTFDSSNDQVLAVLHYDIFKFYQVFNNELIYQYSYSRRQNFALMLKIPLDLYDCLLLVGKDCAYYLIKVGRSCAVTISSNNLKKDFPIRGDNRFIGMHCRNNQYAVLSLYNSIIDILALTPKDINVVNSLIMLIEYEHVIDMADLSLPLRTLFGFLVQVPNNYEFCTYEVLPNMVGFVHAKALTRLELFNAELHKVIALNPNCFLTFSTERIYLYETKGKLKASINLPDSSITLCYTFVDSNKLLIATSKRKLCAVSTKDDDMRVDILGDIPYPSGIAHINDNLVYICSMNEDNVLLRMDNYRVLSKYENLACISDFSLQANEKGEQIIACCNHLEYNEICILKKGFLLKKIAAIPMQMIINMWSINNCLIVGLINETRLFCLDYYKLSEVINASFLYTSRTLLIAKHRDKIIQVTNDTIRLYMQEFTLLQSKKLDELVIIHAVSDPCRNLLAICGNDNKVHVYELEEEIKLVSSLDSVGSEMSAIAFTMNELVVATWESTLELCDIKTGKRTTVKVEGSPVRSMIFVEGFLFCGTSDGYLIVYSVREEGVDFHCCSAMGIKEVKLKSLRGVPGIVALSDIATLITFDNGRFNYLPFTENEQEIRATEKLEDEIILATPQELSVNAIVHNKPLNCRYQLGRQYKFQARKIVSDPTTNHLIILGDEGSNSKLFVFSGTTYKYIDSYIFPPEQMVCSIMITNNLIPNAKENLILVGIAVDTKNSKGELMSLVIRDDKLKIISRDGLNGFVLSLGQYKEFILCSINSALVMFRVKSKLLAQIIIEFSLEKVHFAECVRCSLITFIQINRNIVIAGDITSFIGVYKIVDSELVEMSMHPKPFWAHCGFFIGDRECLVAIKNKLCAVYLDFERRNVEILDSIQLNQDITQIRRGTFVDRKIKTVLQLKMEADKQLKLKTSKQLFNPGCELIYSTNFGSIGVIIGITEEAFKHLNKLEELLIEEPIKRQTFVNGDVVEKFLHLPIDKAKEIYNNIEAPKPSFQELLILIGQLMLFH